MCFGPRTVAGLKHLPWLPRACPGRPLSWGVTDPQGWNSFCTSLPETLASRSSLNLSEIIGRCAAAAAIAALGRQGSQVLPQNCLGPITPVSLYPHDRWTRGIVLISAASNPTPPTSKNGSKRPSKAIFRVQYNAFRSAQPILRLLAKTGAAICRAGVDRGSQMPWQQRIGGDPKKADSLVISMAHAIAWACVATAKPDPTSRVQCRSSCYPRLPQAGFAQPRRYHR
jgi:hypothetical protein